MEERAKALAVLAAQRWRIVISLTGAMMFIYFGFILLIAFNKPLMGSIVIPGLSLVQIQETRLARVSSSGHSK